MITDGDNDLVIRDDADRDSCKRNTAFGALYRDTQDCQQPVPFILDTRTFVGILNIAQE